MAEDLYAYYQQDERRKKRERIWEERLSSWADSDIATFFSTLRDQISQFAKPSAGSGSQLVLAPNSSIESGAVAFGDSRFDYHYKNRTLKVNFVGDYVANLSYVFEVKIHEGDLEHFKDLMTETPTHNHSGVSHSTVWRLTSSKKTYQSKELVGDFLKRLISNRMH